MSSVTASLTFRRQPSSHGRIHILRYIFLCARYLNSLLTLQRTASSRGCSKLRITRGKSSGYAMIPDNGLVWPSVSGFGSGYGRRGSLLGDEGRVDAELSASASSRRASPHARTLSNISPSRRVLGGALSDASSVIARNSESKWSAMLPSHACDLSTQDRCALNRC